MKRSFVKLTADNTHGMGPLQGTGVPAVFSDATRIDLADHTLLFISGKVGIDANGKLAGRTIKEQTRQTLENIKQVLEHEGGTMDDIVRVRVYVTQVDALSVRDIHEVRTEYFKPGRYPASTLVRVDQLIRDGAVIEIDADAVLKPAARS